MATDKDLPYFCFPSFLRGNNLFASGLLSDRLEVLENWFLFIRVAAIRLDVSFGNFNCLIFKA